MIPAVDLLKNRVTAGRPTFVETQRATVKHIQAKLGVEQFGTFGPKTKLRYAFQRAHNCPDGIVGPNVDRRMPRNPLRCCWRHTRARQPVSSRSANLTRCMVPFVLLSQYRHRSVRVDLLKASVGSDQTLPRYGTDFMPNEPLPATGSRCLQVRALIIPL